MKEVFIYGHRAPCSDIIRYIGKSVNPVQRMRSHVSEAKLGLNTRHANWIRSLLAIGQQPILEIIDAVSEEYWPAVEAAYIQYFQDCGFDLTNLTPGGDSPPSQKGKIPSLSTRKKLGDALRGKIRPPFSEEWKTNMSASHKGKKQSPRSSQHCEAIRLAKTGCKHSDETRAKMSAARKGKRRTPFTAEHRANISKALTGKKLSLATINKRTKTRQIRDASKGKRYGKKSI